MAEPDDDEALRAKLEALKGALAQRNAATQAAERGERSAPAADGWAMSMGLRAAGEFAASILIGGFLGWRLDGWLGTKPAFLIAFFLIGSGAGVWNVIRVTSPKTPSKDCISPLSDAQATDKDVRRSAPSAEPGGPTGADDDED